MMQSRLTLLVAATLALFVHACIVTQSHAANNTTNTKHALFVAIPLPGHLNPLISQGLELGRRGWRVTIASPTRMRDHIHAQMAQAQMAHSKMAGDPNDVKLLNMNYLDLGDCEAVGQLASALRRAAETADYMDSAREMHEWALSLHGCMLEGLLNGVAQPSFHKPDIVIADFCSYSGPDLADHIGVPFVINNPDLLNVLPPTILPEYDFNPGTMTATNIRHFNGSENLWGLFQRMIYPPFRMGIRAHVELTVGKMLRESQAYHGVQQTSFLNRFTRAVVLINGFFGLEYPRPTPPNLVMVGPMLSSRSRKHVQDARRDFVNVLSEEDSKWLDSGAGASKKKLPPVLWISMGTIAPLTPRQLHELYDALREGTSRGLFRALWKVDKHDRAHLFPDETRVPNSSTFKVVRWVSSQLGVLAHESTELFITHCGINSVHESVYLEKKVLCIPILADQPDMATRVEDAGIGSHVSKLTFTSSSLLHSIEQLLAPSNASTYTTNLRKARAGMMLSGGVERAGDVLEFVAEYGAASLIPLDNTHPWWARHSFDVVAAWFLILYATYRFWKWVCCRFCCCKRRQPKRDKRERSNSTESKKTR